MGLRAAVRFHMLGPLLVTTADGARIPLRGPRQERLVAALLLDTGRAVSLDRLTEAIWGDHVPATGRRQVQDLVSRLRRSLRDVGQQAEVVHSERDGYRLDVATEQ